MSHHDQSTAAGRAPSAVFDPPFRPPMDINLGEVRFSTEAQEEGPEYLVDIETHQTILVRHATSPEEAIAKAVTGNPDGSDLDLSEVGRDVHVCVHAGLDEDEEETR